MKFKVNSGVDAIREQYKQKYDANFAKLQVATTDRKKEYQAEERRLHRQTHAFMQRNLQYFGAKRREFWKMVIGVTDEYLNIGRR